MSGLQWKVRKHICKGEAPISEWWLLLPLRRADFLWLVTVIRRKDLVLWKDIPLGLYKVSVLLKSKMLRI